ncbi:MULTISPECIES: LysR family transcriptional regulator [Phyllobacteriaceae]|nr:MULTISPECIES: LysR substrate-binding domain-containing protein [Mesorhizobium]MBN9237950.1 LysR family transcriptional regulator [Mesorhizobium sp.]MDQ0333423.1 DNA-binding transcriptional LysR family regulator [Mesorhizobium sp. YL-MeA3-2017]
MTIELRHLRVFVAVAKEGNFRRAAERLNIAQPALSRTIRDLEQLLGVQLFERTTRSVVLTAAGQVFLPEVNDLLEHLAAAIRVTRRVEEGDLGSLTVGFNDFAINDSLPKIIRDFRSLNPGIEIELRSMSSPDMADALRKRRLDIGFLSGEHLVAGLEYEVLRRERLICLLPRGHALADAAAIDLTALAEEPFVLGATGSWDTFIDVVDAFCMSAGFRPRVVQEAAHSDGIVNLVAAGMGISVYVDAAWLKIRQDIVLRRFHQHPPPFATVAAWHPDLKSKALQKFVALARKTLLANERNPDVFSY